MQNTKLPHLKMDVAETQFQQYKRSPALWFYHQPDQTTYVDNILTLTRISIHFNGTHYHSSDQKKAPITPQIDVRQQLMTISTTPEHHQYQQKQAQWLKNPFQKKSQNCLSWQEPLKV